MTHTENNIYWIITEQGREFHYPKALYSLPDAMKHLQKYVDEVGGKIAVKVTTRGVEKLGLFE